MYDKDLVSRINAQLTGLFDIEETRMFGGVAYMLNGNMCLAVWAHYLVLRLGHDGAAQLATQDPYATPFDLTGKPLRGWVKVAPDGFTEDAQLHRYIDMAVLFTGSLPSKTAKSRPA
jgi:hypothetical protein